MGKMGKDQPFLIYGFYGDRKTTADKESMVEANAARRRVVSFILAVICADSVEQGLGEAWGD
jgi:hypothetical protein